VGDRSRCGLHLAAISGVHTTTPKCCDDRRAAGPSYDQHTGQQAWQIVPTTTGAAVTGADRPLRDL
jgi:hypothetical protein